MKKEIEIFEEYRRCTTCNIAKNIDEFYDVFNIKEGNKMYIPKQKRFTM